MTRDASSPARVCGEASLRPERSRTAAAHLSSALSGLGVPARDPAPAGKPAALRLFSANVHHANRTGDDRARWRDHLRWVEEEIRRERGPVVVVGDFSATRYHSSFRRLLSERLEDAHERRGRGR